MLLASEELLGRVRDVACRIDERVRRALSLRGPHGPGAARPEQG